jgi:hypothetical protein
MLVWLATVAGLVAVVALVMREIRRSRQEAGPSLAFTICFYLHDESVMDHFQMGRYAAALRREVEERVSRGTDVGVNADVLGLAGFDGGRQSSREVVSRYLEEAEPISVIGVVVAALEREHVVVHADLTRQAVRRNTALAKALDTAYGSDRVPHTVPLDDLVDPFVLIRGRFRKTDETDESGTPQAIELTARYGSPADPGQGPRVRVACRTSGLRSGDVPGGSFTARCLGKVRHWNAAEGVLEVDALAIFR